MFYKNSYKHLSRAYDTRLFYVSLLMFIILVLVTSVGQEAEECSAYVENSVESVENYEDTYIVSEVEPEYQVSCSEEELYMLTGVVHSEAHNSSYEVKIRIASIVLNRVKEDDFFPNSIKEVIEQPNQFSDKNNPIERVYDCDCIECKAIAERVLLGGSVLPDDVQVYYNDFIKDNWVNTREIYDTVDGVIFAYIYPKDKFD